MKQGFNGKAIYQMKSKLLILIPTLFFAAAPVENRPSIVPYVPIVPAISFADSVKLLIQQTNIAHPDIVYRQAVLESGNFTSAIFRENNNLFGMRRAYRRPHTQTGENRGYAVYGSWQMSVADYALWQAWSAKRLDRQAYIQLLGRIYAEDSEYINNLNIK